MIERLRLENFKAIECMDLPLQRLTVLVGANGSGKSSVLQALHLLGRLVREPANEVLAGTEQYGHLLRWRGRPNLRIRADGEGGAFRLDVGSSDAALEAIRGWTSPAPLTWESHATLETHVAPTTASAASASTDDTDSPEAGFVLQWWPYTPGEPVRLNGPPRPSVLAALSAAVLLRLNAATLTQPSYSDEPMPRVGQDGEGLASALAFMQLTDPRSFASLQESVRAVVPTVKAIRFEKAAVMRSEWEADPHSLNSKRFVTRQYMGESLVFDTASGASLPAHLVSEGTLLVLALLAPLFAPQRPRLLLLDDLDHGLHPQAQKELIGVLRRLLAERPDVQIVATSHSPYLVDWFEPAEVICTALNDAGAAVAAPLAQHPEVERWKAEMTAGDLWSMFGEKWVTERAAAGA